MAEQRSRSELRELFKQGSRPSESDFHDFIESVLNIKDDGTDIFKAEEKPLKVSSIIEKDGNVGVGTDDPKEKLEVHGSVLLGGFTIDDADEWPKFIWCRDIASGWDEGLIKHSSQRGVFGRAGFGIHLHESREWGLWSTGWDSLFGVEGKTGNTRIKGGLLVGGVVVNGGFDFVLGNSDQESRGDSGASRALVKDTDAMLTINYAGDFKGGTQIGSNLKVKGNVEIPGDGTLGFGAKVKQMINLYKADYGIGIQGYTQYFRTSKNFAWYKGGVHNDVELNAGGGAAMMVIKDGNVGIGTTKPGARLDVDGSIKAKAIETTLYTATGKDPVQLSNANKWDDFPELALDINLTEAVNAMIFYQITMPGGNRHLVTRIVVDGQEIPQSRAIAGDIKYWSPCNMFMTRFEAGEHKIVVQYRTPQGGTNNPSTDWQNRMLQVLVMGSIA